MYVATSVAVNGTEFEPICLCSRDSLALLHGTVPRSTHVAWSFNEGHVWVGHDSVHVRNPVLSNPVDVRVSSDSMHNGICTGMNATGSTRCEYHCTVDWFLTQCEKRMSSEHRQPRAPPCALVSPTHLTHLSQI